MRFLAKWAVASLTLAAFVPTFCAGLPSKDGPKSCYMEDDAGHRTSFHLTDHAKTMVVDLGDGAVFTFPKNTAMSDETMHVAAIGTPGGNSTSVLLEPRTGKYQQTFLSPGRSPEFFYGECER